uniref:Uncharacterized protein n=1 Tax=Ananas comosus var. bracteatus TaxID=296719 RepID=A0A6V7Q3S1_ANACO|nr:unnamed protein product [Ananas comosus var. bracteatus]
MKSELGHSESAIPAVQIDDVPAPVEEPGMINVYFHIIDKLDCMGVHKFSQPGIFRRTEVTMHVLNKMQGFGKDELLIADFAKWFSSYFEHILQIPIGAPNVVFHKECQQQGSTEVDCGIAILKDLYCVTYNSMIESVVPKANV